jgi:hypothetical protein
MQANGVADERICGCRVGHHSTSDDSFAYRARAEVEDRKRLDSPLARYRAFLEARGWWDEGAEEAAKARLKKEVLEAFRAAEGVKRGPLADIFGDVWGGEEPWIIVSEREWHGLMDGCADPAFLSAEGAEGGARGVGEEVREGLGAVEAGAGEVRGRRGGATEIIDMTSTQHCLSSATRARDTLYTCTNTSCIGVYIYGS